MFYQQTTLPSGLNVYTQQAEGAKSVALGFWIRAGNRDESPEEYGISHFIEHMLFKGTPSRSAADISQAADALGAEFNAATSREYTVYYSRVISSGLDEIFEVLADMVVNASFDPDALELERGVVTEEIAQSQDMPADQAFDLFSSTFMPTHPLGRPVLGTVESVAAITSEDMHAYHDARYTTGNVYIVACGDVDHDHVVELAQRFCADMIVGMRLERPVQHEKGRKYLGVIRKQTEQAHVLYGFPSIDRFDERKYAYSLLDVVLGGGMSSRMFQEIREKRGLAYSVGTVNQLNDDAGTFALYTASRPENLSSVLSIAKREFDRIAQEGVTSEEFERARGFLSGDFVLRNESVSARMIRMGKQVVSGLPLLSVDETLERYDAVSRDDVSEAAANLFQENPTIAVVSPYATEDVEGMLV